MEDDNQLIHWYRFRCWVVFQKRRPPDDTSLGSNWNAIDVSSNVFRFGCWENQNRLTLSMHYLIVNPLFPWAQAFVALCDSRRTPLYSLFKPPINMYHLGDSVQVQPAPSSDTSCIDMKRSWCSGSSSTWAPFGNIVFKALTPASFGDPMPNLFLKSWTILLRKISTAWSSRFFLSTCLENLHLPLPMVNNKFRQALLRGWTAAAPMSRHI